MDQDVAVVGSSVRVLVIKTQEDFAIAQACCYRQLEQNKAI